MIDIPGSQFDSCLRRHKLAQESLSDILPGVCFDGNTEIEPTVLHGIADVVQEL